MPEETQDPGSFRDPAGSIHIADGRVFRAVSPLAIENFRAVDASGLLGELVESGRLIDWRDVTDRGTWPVGTESAAAVLEHPRLPFVSYPYEWSFAGLRAAALLHLDIHLMALARDVTLSDASAYNVQFQGARPVFIDHLSFRPYREGEFWLAHRQFSEQFLVPLLFRSVLGIAHNAWYRGNVEGIPTGALAAVLPWHTRWRPRVAMHVTLPSTFQRRRFGAGNRALGGVTAGRRFSKNAMTEMLRGLHAWIGGLRPKDGASAWSGYTDDNVYSDDDAAAKRQTVADFIGAAGPGTVFDIGCNTGLFAETALGAGAAQVIGFETDPGALEVAFARARDKTLDFLPLHLDAANPSPAQGWRQTERKGLAERADPGGVLALALIHHLVIGRNIPLDQAIGWLISLAPAGVIEFVPKSDPMVRAMLSDRDDIFADYTFENFKNAVASRARVVGVEPVGATGRELVVFDRA